MSGFMQPEQQEVRPGLFFDDDIDNINDMNKYCNKITSYYVDKDTHLYHIQYDKYLDEMVKKENAYAKAINHIDPSNAIETSPIFGINNTEINIINEWIGESAGLHDRFVVFDWDNTLSLTNGFFAITGEEAMSFTENAYDFALSDKISYLFGDDNRLESIKTVIQKLFENNIKVYILTRNPVAENNKDQFVAMLQVLNSKFDDYSLISAPGSKSAPLAEIGKCIKPSGGKRKSKRRLKKRPKNRKTKNKRISYRRKS
jgi:hypothetical protein